MNKHFQECNVLMGDFNLTFKKEGEQRKIDSLCKSDKYMALKEITRIQSNNQPDHILVDKKFKKHCFATSYFNFASDHKSIVVRLGEEGNELTPEALQRIHFDEELHLKSKKPEKEKGYINLEPRKENNSSYRRKFLNPDSASCWLNSCLHLLLVAFDHSEWNTEIFSEFGKELYSMKCSNSIDPTTIKDIMVFAEQTRIAIRKSEIMNKSLDHEEKTRQLRQIDEVYLNLGAGQQCVRDFFLCLNENAPNWIDLHDFLCFETIDSTMCLRCHYKNEIRLRQIYLEMEVPPDGSSLGKYVEEHFDESTIVDFVCDECGANFQAEKKLLLNSINEADFITILLRRTVYSDEGNMLVVSKIEAVGDIHLM